MSHKCDFRSICGPQLPQQGRQKPEGMVEHCQAASGQCSRAVVVCLYVCSSVPVMGEGSCAVLCGVPHPVACPVV
jgi:hypothetical protein